MNMIYFGPVREAECVLSISTEPNHAMLNMLNNYLNEIQVLTEKCSGDSARLCVEDSERLDTIEMYADHIKTVYNRHDPFRSQEVFAKFHGATATTHHTPPILLISNVESSITTANIPRQICVPNQMYSLLGTIMHRGNHFIGMVICNDHHQDSIVDDLFVVGEGVHAVATASYIKSD